MKRKGKVVIIITLGIVCFLLTMIMFMQFKVVYQTDITSIETMREEELQDKLSEWKIKYEEAESQYREALETLRKYKEESSTDSQTKRNLEEELEKLELMLGTTDVKGQGITIKLEDNDDARDVINADKLMILVNYLKEGGAEAVEVNGERIVNSSFFVDVGSYIKINGKRITAPYIVKAIGEPDYMKSVIMGKNGYIEKITEKGISVEVETDRRITIEKYDGSDLTTRYLVEE